VVVTSAFVIVLPVVVTIYVVAEEDCIVMTLAKVDASSGLVEVVDSVMLVSPLPA
jgi:hypothetical protein